MDCTSRKLDVQGLSTTSMQWGAWGGIGMAVAYNLLPRILHSGLGVLQPSQGVGALEIVLNDNLSPPCQKIISPFQWERLISGAKHIFPVLSSP